MGSDPRNFQIALLATLVFVAYEISAFPLEMINVGSSLLFAVLAQYLATSLWQLPKFEYRSAVITGLSVGLLLRSHLPLAIGLCSFLGVMSKFVIRKDSGHIFNPANFAICTGLFLLTDSVWLSSATWGKSWIVVLVLALIGWQIVSRVKRLSVTFGFFLGYLGLHFIRHLILGDPYALWLHKTQSFHLFLFAFFMITDPKTTPTSQWAASYWAFAIGALAFVMQVYFYRYSDHFFISLIIMSLTTPLWNRAYKGKLFDWKELAWSPGT